MKDLLLTIIDILTYVIFAQVLISWLLAFGVRHPMILTLNRAVMTITDPLMRPLRRVIPNLGMIDITPMVTIIALVFLRKAVRELL
ncbi:MAG: YggT family protein [Chloroflexi bacterium]|jgi:YggT family protein|nr:MAG: YggT family protein [Chloroflexota bacterium]